MSESGIENPGNGGEEKEEHKFEKYLEGDNWKLPTDLRVVGEATEEFLGRLKKAEWDEGEVGLLELGLEEALVNAIGHGNLKIKETQGREEFLKEILKQQQSAPPDLTVDVDLSVNSEEAKIAVRDKGEGFDWKKAMEHDPRDKDALMKEDGRGIFYMRSFFDKVEYNEKGNEVVLTKRRKKEEGK